MGLKKEEFNDYINETDVVLVYVNKFPGFFARIDVIAPDEKKGWYHVASTKLTIPLETFSWLLDENHLACAEFSMNGIPFQFQKVPKPETKTESIKKVKPVKVVENEPDVKKVIRPKVINLFDVKK